MPKINLYRDKNAATTSVSNIFIDEYMDKANGEFVKIYLYLLRQLNSAETRFSISEIADKFEHTEKDIKRALNYWERMELLHLEYDENEKLIGIELLDAVPKAKPAAPAPKTEPAPEKRTYTADELKKFKEEDTIVELLFIAEQYLGRTLTPTDLNAIIYWFDELKLPAELIEYLIEYCVCKGHSSIRYIDKVALSWAENNYQTVEEAKLASGQYNQLYNAVLKAMGISGRILVPAETACVDKWKNEWGFTPEMIQTACEKTITAIHEPSFEYTDKILSNWKTASIMTPADIIKADNTHQKRKRTVTTTAAKNKFNNFDQRSYDYDQLEKMLLTTSAQ